MFHSCFAACHQGLSFFSKSYKGYVGQLQKNVWTLQSFFIACSALKQIRKELDPSLATALPPVQDVPTRWNSTYLMLKRMEILKRSLQLYTANQNGIVALTTNEWNLLKKVIIILQPFYIVTTNISKSKSMISSVIPHVRALHSYLSSSAETDRGMQTLKNELKSSLEKRLLCNSYSSREAMHIFEHTRKLLATSIAVDPRYKVTVFSSNQKDKTKKWLVEEVRNELNFLKAANSHPVEPLTASVHLSFLQPLVPTVHLSLLDKIAIRYLKLLVPLPQEDILKLLKTFYHFILSKMMALL